MLEPQTSQNRGVEEEEEKEKEEEKDKDLKQHSAADAVLKEVNKEFNIYQLLNRLKKELGQPKEFRFPDEIIVNTCLRFLRTRPAIRRVWPWFKESIAQEFMSYNAQKCEAEGKEWKTSPIVRGFEIKAIKEILTIWGKSE